LIEIRANVEQRYDEVLTDDALALTGGAASCCALARLARPSSTRARRPSS
jgi:hypothetical protein